MRTERTVLAIIGFTIGLFLGGIIGHYNKPQPAVVKTPIHVARRWFEFTNQISSNAAVVYSVTYDPPDPPQEFEYIAGSPRYRVMSKEEQVVDGRTNAIGLECVDTNGELKLIPVSPYTFDAIVPREKAWWLDTNGCITTNPPEAITKGHLSVGGFVKYQF